MLAALEGREVPALFAVSLDTPGTGRAGEAGGTYSGGLYQTASLVEAPDRVAAAAQAVGGSLTVTLDYAPNKPSTSYAVSPSTVSTSKGSTPWLASVSGDAVTFVLEDLFTMPGRPSDNDYNDRYLDFTVREVPGISVAADFGASEAGADAFAVTAGRFRLTRSGDTSQALTVSVTFDTGPGLATAGVDFTAPTSVTFAAGEDFAYLDVTPKKDNSVEGSETVRVRVSDGGSSYQGGATADLALADDPPVVSVSKSKDASEYGNDPGGVKYGEFVFTRVGGDPSQSLTANYGATADYEPLPGAVAIIGGQSSVSVALVPRKDSLVENPAEFVRIEVSGPTASYLPAAGDSRYATVTIADAAFAADDAYQLSDGGTLAVSADEGVLINDSLAGNQLTPVPQAPLDSRIASLALNSDGGFSVAVTTGANAATDPITFTYNLVDQAGLVVAKAIAALRTAAEQFNWFGVREVSFNAAYSLPITSDDGTKTYASQQWLDQNDDGTPESKDPVLFVRNQGDSVKADKVVVTPKSELNLDPAKYKLVGEVTRNGAGTGIVLQSAGAGAKDGSRWVFTNLSLAPNSSKFDAVTYDPEMTIRWRLSRMDGQANELKSGQSVNPAYVALAAVQKAQLPQGFKLFRTLVHLGSQGAANVTTDAGMTAHAWSKFSGATPVVKSWDEQALVYYKTWTYRGTGETTTTAGLLKGRDGDCTSFVHLFLNALRAQGIEQQDDFVIAGPTPPPGTSEEPFMFVGTWTAAGAGAAKVADPRLADYKWWNASNTVT